jgi:hypothetical protein
MGRVSSGWLELFKSIVGQQWGLTTPIVVQQWVPFFKPNVRQQWGKITPIVGTDYSARWDFGSH